MRIIKNLNLISVQSWAYLSGFAYDILIGLFEPACLVVPALYMAMLSLINQTLATQSTFLKFQEKALNLLFFFFFSTLMVALTTT